MVYHCEEALETFKNSWITNQKVIETSMEIRTQAINHSDKHITNHNVGRKQRYLKY